METCIKSIQLTLLFTEMESEKQGKEAAVKVEDKVVKVEDKHSLVFFICAWLGVGG